MSLSLPIVNISPFLATSSATPEERSQCAEAISAACRDTGFFYLTNHGIRPERTDEIIQLARTFFLESSEEEKISIARRDAGVENGDGARGWQRIGENVTQGRRDWHEGLDLYRDDNHGDPPYDPLMGRNPWPKTPPQLQERYKAYISDMLSLGTSVVRAMGYALDPEDEEIFVRATRCSFWVMRLIGYPPLPPDTSIDNEAGISCGEHTDYGCVTLLLADSTKGALQVQHKAGQWIDADPVPGTFVVNIGDMIERWTNGLWKSTRHRVIHKGDKWRFSVPFFFEPDIDARIAPLKVCVEKTGGEEKYQEVVYGNFLKSKVEGNFFGEV